jgi:DNA repair exonuclease SbcCD ATPase subunit
MSKRTAAALPHASATQDDSLLIFDQAEEFMTGAAPLDNMDLKVKEAQEQLLSLRMQQEEIEKQKQHLECLRQKQERFVAGKRDLTDKLTRTVSSLDRELYEAQKLVEELSMTKDAFNRHLDVLRLLQPEKWNRSQVDDELDRALTAVEDAEDEFSKGTRRVAAARPSETVSLMEQSGSVSSTAENDDATTWLRRGFAFTLPLMGALFLALILAKLMF